MTTHFTPPAEPGTGSCSWCDEPLRQENSFNGTSCVSCSDLIAATGIPLQDVFNALEQLNPIDAPTPTHPHSFGGSQPLV